MCVSTPGRTDLSSRDLGKDNLLTQGQLWTAKRNTEGPFPWFLLNSCKLRVLGGSLGAKLLVFPLLIVMSGLLGAQISLGVIWV